MLIAVNKAILFKYEISKYYEAGLVLLGSEVKSIRRKQVSFGDAYVAYKHSALWVYNMHVGNYMGSYLHTNTLRPRKLLLHTTEINKLINVHQKKGMTIVPFKLLVSPTGFIKLVIGVCKGKTLYDKRRTLKMREVKRAKDKFLKSYRKF